MTDLLRVQYTHRTDIPPHPMGMREMQARAYEQRTAQYLLLKAPPACGKSRAMMYLSLDKLTHQGIRKVIIAVPEMSIGGSFKDTMLSREGFFADWSVPAAYNLCTDDTGEGGTTADVGKVSAFLRFMGDPQARVLLCTHATLRFAFEKLKASDFNDCLLGIDEFHHASAEGDNKLGILIDALMKGSNAHIVAMTGSYFRGDTVPILLPEDEARFTQVVYTYYEQLTGYQHLKSLGIGYHFYQGRYVDALAEVLDSRQKTLIHIPNVNAAESTKDKYQEVSRILDLLGTYLGEDPDTGIITIQRLDGSRLKVADLVNNDPAVRPRVLNYLRKVSQASDIDIIIALGMAKEGFDWPWCEHALTIGYRGSMTEVIQIIGRATRDCENKPHAQFTNLIAQPDAQQPDVQKSVNNMLKAITLSLLMEQVLAPAITFKPRSAIRAGEALPPGTIVIDDSTKPISAKVIKILNGGSDDLLASLITQPKDLAARIAVGGESHELFTQVELPKLIEQRHPDLSAEEVQQVTEGILTKAVINSSHGLIDEADLPADAIIITPVPPADEASPVSPKPTVIEVIHDPVVGGASTPKSNRQFVKLGSQFINIEHLTLDLIAQVNPFRGAYEILSKSVTAPMLKTIQDVIAGERISMSEEEAVILWPRIKAFKETHGRPPSATANDVIEKRLGEGLVFLRKQKQARMLQGAGA